jgi:hypothetical protein
MVLSNGGCVTKPGKLPPWYTTAKVAVLDWLFF